MKPSGFDIIELLETIILPEAHAMNKSITQATQNDKQISKSIKRFFTRFHISSALKASGAYRKYISAGKQHSSFYRKREKPDQ